MRDPGYAGHQAQKMREAVETVQALRCYCWPMKEEKIQLLGSSSAMLDDGKRVPSIPFPTQAGCVLPASDLF